MHPEIVPGLMQRMLDVAKKNPHSLIAPFLEIVIKNNAYVHQTTDGYWLHYKGEWSFHKSTLPILKLLKDK